MCVCVWREAQLVALIRLSPRVTHANAIISIANVLRALSVSVPAILFSDLDLIDQSVVCFTTRIC